MRHTVQIIAKSYWGELSPPPFSYVSTPGLDDEWEGIKRANRNANVWRYASGSNSDNEAPALGLAYKLQYDWNWNVSTVAWTRIAYTGSTNNYLELTGDSLYHSNNTPGEQVVYRSDPAHSGLTIFKNLPWVFRGKLFKIPVSTIYKTQRFTLRWHRYQLQIIRGDSNASGAEYGIRIMRLGPLWSQTVENAVNFLEDQATVSAADQAIIDAARAEMYEDEQPVAGTISDGVPFEITFIPEPGGRLNILVAGEKDIDRTTVKNSRLLRNRTSGTMWEDTPLTIRNTTGAFQWQVGTLDFARSGTLTLGHFAPGDWVLGDMIFNSIKDVTPPGCDITFSTAPVVGGKTAIIATLTSSLPVSAYTPFLYSVAGYIPGGGRTGDTGTVWDSADHPLSSGSTPIGDLTHNVGTEMEMSWADALVRDPDGATFTGLYETGGLGFGEAGYDYEALENRMVDVTQDGIPLYTNGIVIKATPSSLKSGAPNLARDDITKPESAAALTICDRWALLDEMLMENFAYPGDGLWLNDYLRTILLAAGESTADVGVQNTGTSLANDVFGFGTPRRLPTAPPGETWQVMPSQNETFGDYIRRIVDRWGMGYKIWLNGDGTWGWGIRPNLSTVVAAFHGNATGSYSDQTYPARWTILDPLDLPRDYSEFGNVFTVEGAQGPDGVPLYSSWIVGASINTFASLTSTYRARHHIGRRKPWPLVQDSSLRTLDEVVWVRRSLRKVYGQPGRFMAFGTYSHAGRLFPGDVVTVNGTKGLVVAMSGMSAATDRGDVTVRETLNQS